MKGPQNKQLLRGKANAGPKALFQRKKGLP